MFDSFGKRNTNEFGEAQGESPSGYETWVFWPNGEREHFVVDPSKFDERALGGAANWLTGLSLNGTIVRASVGTGRIQTLTSVVPPSGAQPVAVRITGSGDQPLALVVVFGGEHDAASVKAALQLFADAAGIGAYDLDALVGQCATRSGVAIANFGSKDDAAVDEAYGMALSLGAVMNGSTPAAAASPAATSAPPEAVSGVPVSDVTLEELAILNQRSAFILCGFMPGSRPQAQEWDDWLEQYRLPDYGDGVKLLVAGGAENMIAVNLLTSNAIWGELRTMPHRFVSVYGTTSAYAIPWDGENVPEIKEFSPPDPSQGSTQAAVAAIIGKLERLKP